MSIFIFCEGHKQATTKFYLFNSPIFVYKVPIPRTWRTYQRIVSTHVLQYLCPHAIVCTASLRRPSHLGHKFFLSITDRSAEDNSYPGIVGLKVDAKTNKQHNLLLGKQIEIQANLVKLIGLNCCLINCVQPADQLLQRT